MLGLQARRSGIAPGGGGPFRGLHPERLGTLIAPTRTSVTAAWEHVRVEGDEVAEAVAAVVLGAYGRGRVPRRFWDRLVAVARRQERPGDVVGTDAILAAAQALRREQLGAERALRLLVALSFEALGPRTATAAFRSELAAAVGVEEANLRRYYTAGDVDALARLLGGELLGTSEPVVAGADLQPGVRDEIDAEQARDQTEASAFGWHTTFAALNAWSRMRHGTKPSADSDREPERQLGEWLAVQLALLEAGRLPLAREHQLRRFLERGPGSATGLLGEESSTRGTGGEG